MKPADSAVAWEAERSPPHTGGRGLKPGIVTGLVEIEMSPPHTGGRGLKLFAHGVRDDPGGRPLTRGGAD